MDIVNVVVRKPVSEQERMKGFIELISIVPYAEKVEKVKNENPKGLVQFIPLLYRFENAARLLGFRNSNDLLNYIKTFGLESLL